MSLRFSPEDVQRLATLARLDLSHEEVTLFATQLSEILAFAAEVQSIATDAITMPETDTATGLLREDKVEPSLHRDEVLAAAPVADRVGGLFTVPRVFPA